MDVTCPSCGASNGEFELRCRACAASLSEAVSQPPSPDVAGGPPAVPERIGRFEIEQPLGRGGMAVVYAAHDPELDRRVAIKLIAGGRSAGATARLVREAQAMARLTHPNVVVVHEVGAFADQAFVAMELVEGTNLHDHLAAKSHSWREIIALFVQAGRGLAAAHAAGIVHRDFKPANVLVGTDGRVRVGDFGLAGAATGGDDEPPVRPLGPASETASLTVTGAVVGTPAYMAPEQAGGGKASARSDQYSFCVSLWEALYGRRPMAGETLPPPQPRDQAVPARVRRALVRGLARSPADRWPSMDALTGELLQADPRAARRRWLLAGLVGALLAAAVVGGRLTTQREPPCRRSAEKLTGVWDPAAQASLRAAFLATGAPFAGAAWEGTRRALDAYGGAFTDAHRRTCEATYLRNEQSELLLDARMRCLDERLASLRALVEALRTADTDAVGHSVQAAQALPELASCATVDQARAAALTHDAATDRALADLRALHDLGRYRDAERRGADALAAAERARDRPAAAQAHLLLGSTLRLLGVPVRAEAELSQALWDAEATGQDDMVADAATGLITVVGVRLARPKDAEPWIRLARAALDRLGKDDEREAAFLTARGGLAADRGDYDTAQLFLGIARTLLARPGGDPFKLRLVLSELGSIAYEQKRLPEALLHARACLELVEGRLGPDHPLTANAVGNVGAVLDSMNREDEALALKRRDVAIRLRLGETQDLAAALGNLGGSLRDTGHLDEALVTLNRALAIHEKLVGPDHPDLAIVLYNLSLTQQKLGRFDDARATAERGARIWSTAHGADHPLMALYEQLLGDIATDQGRDVEARAYLEKALALREKSHQGHGMAVSLLALGELDLAHGAPDRARAWLERALAAGSADEELDAKIRFALARSLWPRPADRERARALATEARTALATGQGTEPRQLLVDVDAWLARPR